MKALYTSLTALALVIGSFIGYFVGFNAEHDISYLMERTEDGVSTIEVYDHSTETLEYINIKFRK